MLRLPAFELHTPETVDQALHLAATMEGARFIAGGTDLLPNLKHEMIEAQHVISLAGIAELKGICVADDGGLVIGPMTSLSAVAADADVARIAPALSQAAGLVAGPQHRNQGTLGGNVMLDTRCQWINQSYFWREALGFCLKKDGALCHVIEGGKRCVAAVSNDTIAPLFTLDAKLSFATAMKGPSADSATVNRKDLPVEDLFKADGAYNKKVGLHELLTAIRIPATPAKHRGTYQKLRLRNSIDFPQLGVAARLDFDADGVVTFADLVLIALAARPSRVKQASELLVGQKPGTDAWQTAMEELLMRASRSCRPLPNIPGDTDWRERMVPVYIKKAFAVLTESH
jgi:4-hydroxybenzoyl-CoA reductase subunit beta